MAHFFPAIPAAPVCFAGFSAILVLVMEMTRLIFCFLFYSLLGFFLESGYALATHSRRKGRKSLLFLPLCPVYGLGALAILALPDTILQDPLLLPVPAALAATGAELMAARFYRLGFRFPFWDYSGWPFQYRGDICLLFSAAWGLLSLPLVYWVQPWEEILYALTPPGWIWALWFAFWGDALCSAWVLQKHPSPSALRWWVTESSGG